MERASRPDVAVEHRPLQLVGARKLHLVGEGGAGGNEPQADRESLERLDLGRELRRVSPDLRRPALESVREVGERLGLFGPVLRGVRSHVQGKPVRSKHRCLTAIQIDPRLPRLEGLPSDARGRTGRLPAACANPT